MNNINDMRDMRPYNFQMMYEWISDSGKTPYITVNCNHIHTLVPVDYIDFNNNKITLNIADSAVEDLDIQLKHISFSARFGGGLEFIHIPMEAIGAIYARENGAGSLLYSVDETQQHSECATESKDKIKSPQLNSIDKKQMEKSKAVLKLV